MHCTDLLVNWPACTDPTPWPADRHSFTRGSLDGYSFTVLVTPLSSDIAAPGVCLQFRHKHHGPYTGFVYRQAKYVMSLSWASTFQASDGTQRVGGAVYENESIVVAKHFERVDWSSAADRQIAFLMGSHARLGAASWLAGLDAGIMRSIVRNCRGLSLQLGAPWSWD